MKTIKRNLISIILPIYNGEKYVKEAIESILNQTYSYFELIIVDDCSNDSTPAIINQFTQMDNRIRVFRNKINRKLPVSLNIGFKLSCGQYITWTSDDNLYSKDALEKMINEITKEKKDIVYSSCYFIDSNGKKIGKMKNTEAPTKILLKHNTIGACFLYRREVQEILGGYDAALFLAEDYDFWLRAYVMNYQFGKIMEPLYWYRVHDRSLSSKRKQSVEEASLRAKEKVLFRKGASLYNKIMIVWYYFSDKKSKE